MLSALNIYTEPVLCARLGRTRCLTTPALLSKMLQSLSGLCASAAQLFSSSQPLNTPYNRKSKTPGRPTWTCISFSATCISELLLEDEWMLVTHLQTDCPGVVSASIWGVAPSSPKASWETMVSPNWLCFLFDSADKRRPDASDREPEEHLYGVQQATVSCQVSLCRSWSSQRKKSFGCGCKVRAG